MATATLELAYIPTFTPRQEGLMRRRYRAWQMRQEGMTLEAIAEALGTSGATICRDLQRFERMQPQHA